MTFKKLSTFLSSHVTFPYCICRISLSTRVGLLHHALLSGFLEFVFFERESMVMPDE